MTFHKTKRAVTTLAVMTSWSVLCIASPSAAQAEDSEAGAAGEAGASKEGGGDEKEKSRLNSIRLSGSYAFHLLEHRDSATTGEPLHTREHLGGFEIAYERELIEEHLSIEFAKPFYFSRDTWETPFEATLKGLFVKGPWEGYIGAILSWNIRIFSKERAEFEGQKNVLSFGVGGTIGGSYHFNEIWALELGLDYEYIPTDPVVSHEFDVALGGVYHF
jgi:hypothetical protein